MPKAAPTRLHIHKALFTVSPVVLGSLVPAVTLLHPYPLRRSKRGAPAWKLGSSSPCALQPGVLTFWTWRQAGRSSASAMERSPGAALLFMQTATAHHPPSIHKDASMQELPRPQACTHSVSTCHACRSLMREDALRQAPGRPIILLKPAPVTVRAHPGTAVAYTVTDVLVEWDGSGGYQLRWEASWLVRKVEAPPDSNGRQDAGPLPIPTPGMYMPASTLSAGG